MLRKALATQISKKRRETNLRSIHRIICSLYSKNTLACKRTHVNVERVPVISIYLPRTRKKTFFSTYKDFKARPREVNLSKHRFPMRLETDRSIFVSQGKWTSESGKQSGATRQVNYLSLLLILFQNLTQNLQVFTYIDLKF